MTETTRSRLLGSCAALLVVCALSACGGPNSYLEALERDHPVLSDFEPEVAIRTDRSTKGGTGIQANGQRTASVSQHYIPASGDESPEAVLQLLSEFASLLEADGWILSPYAPLYSPDQPGLRGHQGGKRRVSLLVLQRQGDGEGSYLSFVLLDRP